MPRYPKRRAARAGPYRKRYRGRGDYKSDQARKGLRSRVGLTQRTHMAAKRPSPWGIIPRALGTIGGGLLGGVGGAGLGYEGGAMLSRYMGLGDYSKRPRKNALMSSQAAISVNQHNASGDIVWSHTEFVGNVVVPARADAGGGQLPSFFDVASFAINPGLEEVFPFLSKLASNFEMYEFSGLIFQYKPLSSESATTTNSLGKVILCTNYDASAPAFLSSASMQNYDYASTAKPSVGQIHGVETKASQRLTKQLYIKLTSSPPGIGPVGQKDKLLTDLGLFQIATEGVPVGTAPSLVGELWVTYQVKLSRATIVRSIGLKEAEFCSIAWDVDHAVTTGLPTYTNILQDENNTFMCRTAIITGAPGTNRVSFELPLAMQSGTYIVMYNQTTVLGTPIGTVTNQLNYRTVTPWLGAGTFGPHVVSGVQAGNSFVDGLTSTASKSFWWYINLDAIQQNTTVSASFNFGYTSGPTGGAATSGVAGFTIWQVPTGMALEAPIVNA